MKRTRLLNWTRQSLMSVISWSMIFSQGPLSTNTYAGDWDQPNADGDVVWSPEQQGELRISYDESQATVNYGQYAEVEVTLEGSQSGDVTWSVDTQELPPGMEMEVTNSPQVLLLGVPRFQDKWCFPVTASVNDGQDTVISEEICLFSSLPDSTNIQESFLIAI